MRVLLLLGCLATTLAAQTPPAAFYPLGIGDVREYRGSGPPSPFRPYIARETVIGDTLAGGRRYWLVERLSISNGLLERSRRAVRFDTATAQPVERMADGSEAPRMICRFEPGAFCLSDGESRQIMVGADALTRPTFVASNLVAHEVYAAGLGLVERAIEEGADFTEHLVFARIDGLRFGVPSPSLPPLAPSTQDFWPLARGNAWAYTVQEYSQPVWNEFREVVGDTLVGARAYAVVRWCSAMGTARWSCVPRYVRVDGTSGSILEWAGGTNEHALMCGLAAEPMSNVSCLGSYFGVVVVTPGPTTVSAGGVAVQAGEIRVRDLPVDPGFAGWAAGFGQVEPPVWFGWSLISYARLGGVEYGVNPVAGEEPPSVQALELRVAPNPAAGIVTVRLERPAEVEAFDSLGRRVWHAAVPGTAQVDTGSWAPGLYLFRAQWLGGGVATARIVRR